MGEEVPYCRVIIVIMVIVVIMQEERRENQVDGKRSK